MIQLSFTPQELDYIANLLSKQPWHEVNALMVNIQNQVVAQQKGAQDAGTSSSGVAAVADAGAAG